MKIPKPSSTTRRGFTWLVMSIVILVLVTLMSSGLIAGRKVNEGKLGREMTVTPREVYSAQRMFLGDVPICYVNTLTHPDHLPYMRGNSSAMLRVKSLTGAQLSIRFNGSPLVINNGSGVSYDPSGNNRDSQWDVGV